MVQARQQRDSARRLLSQDTDHSKFNPNSSTKIR
ncbi:hypothetical protein ACL2XO_17250 [Sodalis sp. RH15]